MFEKLEMRLSGSGGQGIVLASIIFADAALQGGLNVVQTQSFGPEARGGASKSEVIISKDNIKYPMVTKPDVLLALTQKSYEKYVSDLGKDAILVVDEGVEVNGVAPAKVYQLPIIKTAHERIGKSIVTNIVSIGALYNIIAKDLIDLASMKKAIANRVPPAFVDLNIQAFEEGSKLTV